MKEIEAKVEMEGRRTTVEEGREAILRETREIRINRVTIPQLGVTYAKKLGIWHLIVRISSVTNVTKGDISDPIVPKRIDIQAYFHRTL